jgi:protein-disulfide isomerase
MSRKTNRSLPSPPSLQPPAGVETRANRVKRRNLFVGSVLVLFLAFAAAAMLYHSEHANSGQLAAAKNHPALASTHSPNFGHADAKVHIVEFLDPACETCAAFFPHVKALMSAHPGKVRLSLRHVPFHRGSDWWSGSSRPAALRTSTLRRWRRCMPPSACGPFIMKCSPTGLGSRSAA